MVETQSLNIPGETNTAHGVQWSLKLHHLRLWPVTLLKHLTKCYTWLLFNLSCLQEISWASSSIYISFPGSSRNLKTLPASGLNSSCRILLTSICEQQTKISRLCDHSSLIIRHLPKTASDFNNCKGQSIHPPTFFFLNVLFILRHTQYLSTKTVLFCQHGRQLFWKQGYYCAEGLHCLKINAVSKQKASEHQDDFIPRCIHKDSDYIPISLSRKYLSMLSSVFN